MDAPTWDQTTEAPPPSWDETSDVPNKLSSFTRGAANNFPMLPQAIAEGANLTGIGDTGGGYSGNLQNWNAKAQAAKQANPVSYGAGAVAGSLAPLAIPGVGEALEAAPIATNAGLGALSAVSNSDLSKNPEKNAKDALLGAGIGGATAGVLGKFLPSESGMTQMAEKKALQSAELPSGIVGAMKPEERQELSKFIEENGLVDKNKSQALEVARGLSKKYGGMIGDVGDKTETLHIDPNEHYQAVQGLISKGKQYEGLENREAKSLAHDYTSGANDILHLPDHPAWNDIQGLKEQYGKLAFNSKGEVKSEGAKDTYFALKDMLKSIADKSQDNPNLGAEYKEALKNYSRMQPIETGLERAVDEEMRGGAGMGARGMLGLIRKLPGPARTAAGILGAAMGHPMVPLVAALPELMNPAIQSKAARAVAPLAGNITGGVNQAVHNYLINQFQKKKDKTQ